MNYILLVSTLGQWYRPSQISKNKFSNPRISRASRFLHFVLFQRSVPQSLARFVALGKDQTQIQFNNTTPPESALIVVSLLTTLLRRNWIELNCTNSKRFYCPIRSTNADNPQAWDSRNDSGNSIPTAPYQRNFGSIRSMGLPSRWWHVWVRIASLAVEFKNRKEPVATVSTDAFDLSFASECIWPLCVSPICLFCLFLPTSCWRM